MEVNKQIIKFITGINPLLPSFMIVRDEFLFIGNKSILYKMSLKSIDALFGDGIDWNIYNKVYYINKSIADTINKNIEVELLLNKCIKKTYNQFEKANEKTVKWYNTSNTNIKQGNIIKILDTINNTLALIDGYYINANVLNNVIRLSKLDDNFPYCISEKDNICKIGNYIIPVLKKTETINQVEVKQSNNIRMEDYINEE